MSAASIRFAKIFVVADPTRMIQPALLRAEAIARLNRARIALYCCIAGEPPEDTATPAGLEVKITRDWLERVADTVRSHKIEIHVEVECSTDWRQAIVEAAARAECDLIVKSTSRHSLVGRMFSATADWMLLHTATSPVLLVSGAGLRTRTHRRLLAAIKLKPEDPEHEEMNARIIDLAHHLSAVAGFEMHAVTAYRGDDVFYDRQAFANSCRLPRNQVHAAEGAPQHAIAAVAADIGADTIVIGNPADSDTAHRLIDHVDADVLVLPPDSQ